jgi:methionyl-tRNA synthetase
MVVRYCDGVVPTAGAFTADDLAIQATEKRVTDAAAAAIDQLAIHDALSNVWELVDELNGYITLQEPWALAKKPENRERLGTVLHTAVRGLGTLAVLLSPVIPVATGKLWIALGGDGALADQRVDLAWEWTGGAQVTALEPLFPRIESIVEPTDGE